MNKQFGFINPQNEMEDLIRQVGYVRLYPGPMTSHELVPLGIWLGVSHGIQPVVYRSAKGWSGAVIDEKACSVDIIRTNFETSTEVAFHAATRALQILAERKRKQS